MAAEEQIFYQAFSRAPQPAPREITSDTADPERAEIAAILGRYPVAAIPGEVLAAYPLSTMFPLLTDQSFRYYMPRCITHCLEERNRNSLLCESLVYALANANQTRIGIFAEKERTAVFEFLQRISVMWGEDEYIKDALRKWK